MIDRRLRALSERLEELEKLTYGSASARLRASGQMDEIEAQQRDLRDQITALWPSRPADVESLDLDRIVTFLETAPRHLSAEWHAKPYWRVLARSTPDDATRERIVDAIIAHLGRGFSASLEYAVPVAAQVWSRRLAEAVARARAEATDPVRQAALARFSIRVARNRGEADPSPLPPRPGAVHPRMLAAARRLQAAVEQHVSPELRAQWRFEPPATDEQIRRLEETIAPFPLPSSLETWLRFANGIRGAEHWPGFVFGPWYGIERIIEVWDVAHEYVNVPPGLMPLGYGSHIWLTIELVGHREAALGEFGAGSSHVFAPSLPAFFEAAADCVDAGWFQRWREAGPWGDDPVRREFARIWNERLAQDGWEDAPSSPGVELDENEVPVEWTTPVQGTTNLEM
jgi:hypothetical protein